MIKKNHNNMKGYDKRKSHISSKIHVIYISSNNVRHPVTKTFTTLHPTTLHSTSLHFTQLHFTPLHYTCRHFISSHLAMTGYIDISLRGSSWGWSKIWGPIHYNQAWPVIYLALYETLQEMHYLTVYKISNLIDCKFVAKIPKKKLTSCVV
jgi:hypothetical protein